MTNDTNTPKPKRRIDRRTLLSGVSSALVALAGCTNQPSPDDTSNNSSNPTTESPASQSAVFADVEVDGGKLVTALDSDTSADWVRLFGPNGGLFAESRVSPDAKQTYLDLVGETTESYIPGTHRLVAAKDDEILGEVTVDLTPRVALTDFRWAKKHPEMDWDKSANNWEEHAAFRLENTGNGPAILKQTRWQNAPFVLRTDENEQTFDHSIVLPPEETTTVYSTPPVYETSGGLVGASAIECETIDTKTLQLTTVIQPGSNPTYSETIEYGGEQGACDLTILDSETTNQTQTTNGSDT